MSEPQLTETMIQGLATPQSFSRGLQEPSRLGHSQM
jgi:hypothetical protein